MSECAPITTYNYDGEKEETVYASDYTTVADLPAAADWTAASIEVTLNNGQKQGYVPALMVQTTDAAVVEFDHIYMTYPVEDTENLTDGFNFVTSENWYPSLALFDGITIPEASEVWNGETEAPTANDEGIYIIDTAEKLAYIIKNGGKMIIGSTTTQEPVVNENDDAVLDEEGNPTYKDVTTYEYNTNCTFKLTKDIYLNDISKANWLADENNSSVRAWYTSETSTHFGGTIDGNFHTIYGVYSRYNWTDIWHGHTGGTSRGLIPAIGSGRTAVIKNLTVDCSNIFAENNAGAIVGTNRGATLTIDSCTAGKNVYLKSYRVGAILGSETTSGGQTTINNCASYATTVIGSLGDNYGYYSRGLVNSVWSHNDIIITNSFNANGPITSRTIEHMSINNCFATEEGNVTTGAIILTTEQMQGTNVLDIDGTMPTLNSNGNYWLAEEALGTIPEDYNVIVLSHMAITTNGAGDESYANGNVLSDIMQAYQTKTTYTNEDIGMTEAVDFTTDTGRIMVYQHGHEHYVYEKYNAGPQVWQFSSSTPNPHSGGLGGRIFNENAASINVMSVTEGYVYKQAQGHGDSGMFINKFPVYESDVNLDTKVDICDLVKFDNLELAALPAVPAANTTLEKLRKLLIGA